MKLMLKVIVIILHHPDTAYNTNLLLYFMQSFIHLIYRI